MIDHFPNRQILISHTILSLVLVTLGCRSDSRSSAGGTEGMLTIGTDNHVAADLKVNAFVKDAANTWRCLGYGVTDTNGMFQLRSNDAATPVFLKEGTYKFTLESISADPIPIDEKWSEPARSQLMVDWHPEEKKLLLSVPRLSPMQ